MDSGKGASEGLLISVTVTVLTIKQINLINQKRVDVVVLVMRIEWLYVYSVSGFAIKFVTYTL